MSKMNKPKNRTVNDYMSIKNVTDTSADIYFYGDIVGSEWGKWEDTDTCPSDVLNLLDQAKNAKELNIYVNSGGGSVFAGLAIYNMLKRHTAYKTVYIDALAASIASVIALSGDRVVMPDNAFFMIHKPWNYVSGNANDLRKAADDLDRIEEGILNVYAENLKEGVTIEQVKEMVNNETWLVGPEAANVFNIELVEANNAAACIGDSLKGYRNVPESLVKTPEPEPKAQTATDKPENDALESLKLQLELLTL